MSRIVLDARYIRRRSSGIKSYMEALIELMPAMAPDLDFHVWGHSETPVPINSAHNVSQKNLRASANGLRTLISPSGLDALRDGDVFHAMFNVLGYRVRIPTVTTIHDIRWIDRPKMCDANPLRRRVRSTYFARGIRNAMRHSTRILTVSRATADLIVEHCPQAEERIRITPCGCDPAYRPPDSLRAARLRAAAISGTEAPYFLAVGVHFAGKGHDVALRAFADVAKPHERLVIVHRLDGGPQRKRLIDELGLSDRVILLKGLPLEDLVTLMQGATALLQPSRYEGFGIPVLEAMSCACPVIASDIPALKEVLGPVGKIVPVEDHVGLGRAMRAVADQPGVRDEIVTASVDRAATMTWESTARATIEAYREAIAAGTLARTG